MPTRSYSGGATSLKKSLFHKATLSFISFYPRSSAFIPVEQSLGTLSPSIPADTTE
jgi:hypothetical protein